MSSIKVPFWKDSIKPVIVSPKDTAADLILLIPPPSSINSPNLSLILFIITVTVSKIPLSISALFIAFLVSVIVCSKSNTVCARPSSIAFCFFACSICAAETDSTKLPRPSTLSVVNATCSPVAARTANESNSAFDIFNTVCLAFSISVVSISAAPGTPSPNALVAAAIPGFNKESATAASLYGTPPIAIISLTASPSSASRADNIVTVLVTASLAVSSNPASTPFNRLSLDTSFIAPDISSRCLPVAFASLSTSLIYA